MLGEELTLNQIDYVLFHLNHHVKLTNDIKTKIKYCDYKNDDFKNTIIFSKSHKTDPAPFYIQEIPILFPVKKIGEIFYIDNFKNLVFNHDLIKSAFWLLSGVQELTKNIGGNQHYGYNSSLQKKDHFISKPVVDHYFKIMCRGIAQFCQIHELQFEERTHWNHRPFGFCLTHDVDRIQKWNWAEIKLQLKKIIIPPYNITSLKHKLHKTSNAVKNFHTKNDPYWNFSFLKSIEMKYGIQSAWYFLPKGIRHIDAYYSFRDPQIRELLQYLKRCGDEIGLHSTSDAYNKERYIQNITEFTSFSKQSAFGNRQHWLNFIYPDTLNNLAELGVLYDSSWYFNQHIGWRNSYSMPFKPYNIIEDKMIDIWEIPLCIMDRTLLQYQHKTLREAQDSIIEMINNVFEVNGLIVLLWHNSFFDEEQYPGITDFYIHLIHLINSYQPINILPLDIANQFNRISYM